MSPRFDEVRRLADLEKKARLAWKIVYREREIQVIAGNEAMAGNEEIFDDGSAHSEYYSNFGIDDPNINFAVDLRNASPWLLEVAGCFQLGDSNLMGELISAMDAYFGGYYGPHKAALHRLKKAAEIVEEKE